MATAKKTTPLVVPLSALRGACREQRALVRKEWPKGIPLTAKAMKRCLALHVDLNWAAAMLLDVAERDKYVRATEPAWLKYDRAKEAAWAKYKEYGEYQRAIDAAWYEYVQVKAAALLRLLRKQYRKGAAT